MVEPQTAEQERDEAERQLGFAVAEVARLRAQLATVTAERDGLREAFFAPRPHHYGEEQEVLYVDGTFITAEWYMTVKRAFAALAPEEWKENMG